MEFLFLLLHTIFFGLIILNLPFFQKTGIRKIYLLLIFLAKIVIGLGYNYIHSEVLAGGDPWLRANDAMVLLEAFQEHPKAVLKYIFLPETYWDKQVLQPYLNHFTKTFFFSAEIFLVRLYFIVLFITGGYFYGFIPMLAFILLLVNLKLFELFRKTLPDIDKKLLLWTICFLPTATFFTSGLYKDALMYIALGLCLINSWSFLNEERRWSKLLWVLGGLIIMLLFRWADFILYFPVLIAYFIIHHSPDFPFFKYAGILIILLTAAFIADYFIVEVDILEYLYRRKSTVRRQVVASNFETADWRYTDWAILTHLPMALINALFRPFPQDVQTAFQGATFIESVGVFLFLVFGLVFRKQRLKMTPLLGFLLFIALARLCFNGLFIENVGTIVRHRSEILMFLLVFWMGFFMDFEKIKQKFSIISTFSIHLFKRLNIPSLFLSSDSLTKKRMP